MGEKANIMQKLYGNKPGCSDTQIEDFVRFMLKTIDNWGYMQNEIAHGLGISESYLSKILSRKASLKVTATTLNEILDYLGADGCYPEVDAVKAAKKYGLSGRYERVKHLRELDKQAYLLSHLDRQHIIGEIIEAIPKADNEKLLKIKEMLK